MVGVEGFEPPTSGITIQDSNQLSYSHHWNHTGYPSPRPGAAASRLRLARPAGLEPATTGLEGRCSIRLSYGRLGA